MNVKYGNRVQSIPYNTSSTTTIYPISLIPFRLDFYSTCFY